MKNFSIYLAVFSLFAGISLVAHNIAYNKGVEYGIEQAVGEDTQTLDALLRRFPDDTYVSVDFKRYKNKYFIDVFIKDDNKRHMQNDIDDYDKAIDFVKTIKNVVIPCDSQHSDTLSKAIYGKEMYTLHPDTVIQVYMDSIRTIQIVPIQDDTGYWIIGSRFNGNKFTSKEHAEIFIKNDLLIVRGEWREGGGGL